MSYVEKILLPGEQVIGFAVLHWIIYLRGVGITIFGGILGFLSRDIVEYLFGTSIDDNYGKALTVFAALVVAFGVYVLFCSFMRQTATEIVITNHRLIAKYGIIARATYEIMANRITGANFDQSVLGRMLGFGTIWVHGAGGEVSPIYMVSEPQKFYRAIIGVLERFQAPR